MKLPSESTSFSLPGCQPPARLRSPPGLSSEPDTLTPQSFTASYFCLQHFLCLKRSGPSVSRKMIKSLRAFNTKTDCPLKRPLTKCKGQSTNSQTKKECSVGEEKEGFCDREVAEPLYPCSGPCSVCLGHGRAGSSFSHGCQSVSKIGKSVCAEEEEERLAVSGPRGSFIC